MAKDRGKPPVDDFDDGPPPSADDMRAATERIAYLEHALEQGQAGALERVRELEKQLTQAARAPAPVLASGPVEGASGYWRVSLENAPSHVVQAQDPANAWEVYRGELGVRTSDFQPVVTVATREEYRAAQAWRHGKRPEEWRLPDD